MGKRHESRQHVVRDPHLRHFRLEHLLREELHSLFDSEITDPQLLPLDVVRVELSRDGARLRAWLAVGSSESDNRAIQAALERASGFLRRRLCDALPLKRSPELSFRLIAHALDDGSIASDAPSAHDPGN